jgi:eukaryotic-like serine/threonine-protein kinase
MTGQVIPRDKLGSLTKIGQGGQGVVYGAPNVKTKFAASMVYKEYKPQTLAAIDFTALAAMPALVEDSLSYAEGERLISAATWPCALVENAGTTTGFVMPAIPEQFFIPFTTAKGVSNVTGEFQHLLNHPTVLAARGIDINDAQRYSLLREVASTLAFLHKHGVCVGDISPKNLLFSLTPHQAIYLIDCDAMRINGVSALPQVETPGWEAPAGEELATIYTDTYKLGLLALRLLAGDQDTTNPDHLPSTTPNLVRQIITDTLKPQPDRRPLPEAWTHVLGDAIEQAEYRLKTTSTDTAPADLGAPAIPVVHSRPSTPTSRPRPQTPTPPAPAPPASESNIAALTPSAPDGRRSRTNVALVVGVIAFIAGIAAAVGIPALAKHQPSHSSSTSKPSAQPPYGAPVVLPFTGLNHPGGVAVDTAGAVYLTDDKRVLKLTAGSSNPTVLPVHDDGGFTTLAVDNASTTYIAASGSEVWRLAPGSSTPIELPSLGSRLYIRGLAVDGAGNVYATDAVNCQVLKLAPSSSDVTVLPFAHFIPTGVAVDSTGAIYVSNADGPVLKLAAGSSTPTELPFKGLRYPQGLAVDAAGTVYVTDAGGDDKVFKLEAGSSTPTTLPFAGLSAPEGVAVDAAGNLYVADTGNNRVVKLPVQ